MILTPLLGQERANKYAPTVGEALSKIKAGNYQNTKADVFRAVKDVQRHYGISQQQISSMVGLLDNPKTSGFLNKISPNLVHSLKNLGNEICEGNSAPTQTNGGTQNKFPPLKKR